MKDFTKSEKYLACLMKIYVPLFGIAGFLFLLFPQHLLDIIDLLAEFFGKGKVAASAEAAEMFWVFMSFSMMMTIATCSYLASKDIRKNRPLVIPIIFSKLASSISGLIFYLFAGGTFAYLIIFLADFPLFLITLFLFAKAHTGMIPEAYRSGIVDPQNYLEMCVGDKPSIVACLKGEDKFKILDQVLKETGFFEVLNSYYKKSGKSKSNFSIVVKANFMMTYNRQDVTTYTDPELVEHLFDRIAQDGFSNLSLVESQNTYGNYFHKRDVLSVAEYVGYSRKNYKIVDITKEKVEYDYGGSLGRHWVGPTWRDADFRISFAKNKTHSFCYYTLTLKNIYGTLPLQNKLLEYHKKKEFDWPTIETLKHFPVHFGLIDAFISGDGQMGVIADTRPNKTRTIIGGEKLVAVDWVGAKKMGLDPLKSCFMQLASREFGRPDKLKFIGDTSLYEPWENVEELLVEGLALTEESWIFSDWFTSVFIFADPFFPKKKTGVATQFLRRLIKPILPFFFTTEFIKKLKKIEHKKRR